MTKNSQFLVSLSFRLFWTLAVALFTWVSCYSCPRCGIFSIFLTLMQEQYVELIKYGSRNVEIMHLLLIQGSHASWKVRKKEEKNSGTEKSWILALVLKSVDFGDSGREQSTRTARPLHTVVVKQFLLVNVQLQVLLFVFCCVIICNGPNYCKRITMVGTAFLALHLQLQCLVLLSVWGTKIRPDFW